jgi:pyridoxine 5-phosphate synthase
MKPWRPAFEFNIEGYPDERFFDIVEAVRPEQCTLVPDPPNVFTSEEGWKLASSDSRLVTEAVARLRHLGCRVILFIDPDPSVVARVPATGADGIEIYTGAYADAFRKGAPDAQRKICAQTATAARALGLAVNIGHDLNLENLPPLMADMSGVGEASIGHELTADALEMGFANAVAAYAAALAGRS